MGNTGVTRETQSKAILSNCSAFLGGSLPSLFVLSITLISLSTSIHLTPLQELGASISKERIELAATRSGLLATESS